MRRAARRPSRPRRRPAGRTPSGCSSSRLKPPVFGSVSSSRWIVLASRPGALAQPLRRPAGRGGERHLDALRDQHLEDRVDQRGLADAGAAGDHQHLRARARGAPPRAGSPPARGRSCPSTQGSALSVSIAGQGGGPSASRRSRSAMPRSARCRPARNTQARPSTSSATTSPGLELQRQRLVDRLGRDLEQLGGERSQLVRRQAAVALVHRLRERVGDPGPHPDRRGLLDPELGGHDVGGPEADAADVAREPVRVLRDQLDGVVRRRS